MVAEPESKFNVDDVVAFSERVANGNIVEAETPEGAEMTEWVFTNDPSNQAIRQLFHMFVHSAFTNKLGVMHAKRKNSNIIDTVVVGIEVVDGQIATWPIAKLLTEEEQGNYQAPDGEGGFLE